MNKRDIIEYLVVFVDSFAKMHRMDNRQSFLYLQHYGALDFLEQQYNVAHTMGFNYMVNAMTDYCKRNGGDLQ